MFILRMKVGVRGLVGLKCFAVCGKFVLIECCGLSDDIAEIEETACRNLDTKLLFRPLMFLKLMELLVNQIN